MAPRGMEARVRRAWIGASVVVLWLGCGAKLLSISVEESTTTVVEEGTLLEQTLVGFGFDELVSMDVVASQELQNQGVSPGDIRDVRLVWMTLEALDGQGDRAFLDSLAVYVEAPDLERVRVASLSDFPAGQALVELQIDDVDLTDYATSRSMTLSTEVDGNRPSDDTTIEVAYELDVGVTGQGACGAL